MKSFINLKIGPFIQYLMNAIVLTQFKKKGF